MNILGRALLGVRITKLLRTIWRTNSTNSEDKCLHGNDCQASTNERTRVDKARKITKLAASRKYHRKKDQELTGIEPWRNAYACRDG